MYYLIKTDLKICFESKRYRGCFLCLFSIFLVTFFNYSSSLYGKTSINLKPNYNMGIILNHSVEHSVYIMLMILLPIISCILYSDSVIRDKNNGIFEYYMTRNCTVKKYLLSKASSVFIINFMSIFFVLASIEIFIWIAIPNIGCKTEFHTPVYENIGRIRSSLFWTDLYYLNPYLYIIFIIFIMAYFSSLLGIIALSFSILFSKLKSTYLAIITFFFINIIEIILPDGYIMGDYFQISPYELTYFIKAIIGWTVFTFLLLYFGIQKEKRGLL